LGSLAHGSSYRHAMDMGVGAYERGRQTTYTIRRLNYLEGFLTTWCRGLLVSPQLREGSAASHESSGPEDSGAHGSAVAQSHESSGSEDASAQGSAHRDLRPTTE
jgi:hypothetical protein